MFRIIDHSSLFGEHDNSENAESCQNSTLEISYDKAGRVNLLC